MRLIYIEADFGPDLKNSASERLADDIVERFSVQIRGNLAFDTVETPIFMCPGRCCENDTPGQQPAGKVEKSLTFC
jgi:hypothetical protein